jgi:hypothetical protein
VAGGSIKEEEGFLLASRAFGTPAQVPSFTDLLL